MKRLSPVIAIALLLALSCQSRNDASTKADPVIFDAIAQVNIDSVRTYIDDLVALHTRHTLSTQTDPARGLGAAIAYLERRCGRWTQSAPAGRPAPRVERVYYTAGENGGRYDRVVSVPELMVTLPGTDGAPRSPEM